MEQALEQFGWNAFFERGFAPYAGEGLSAGRIALEHKSAYVVYSACGELSAAIAGKLRWEGVCMPAVGDWVAMRIVPEEDKAVIHAVLPRAGKFSRKAAGTGVEEQVVAANVDVVLLVSGLDGDYNPRRIERYVTVAWESGARPVVVLNKADLCPALDAVLREVESIAPGVPVLVTGALLGEGLDALRRLAEPGRTLALLGSSGAGKSTIINRLLGRDRQRVAAVRADDSRGRHTTTQRELIVMEGGGLLLDTPGMRGLQLLAGEDSVNTSFDEIDRLAAGCRFHDCLHQAEPGCAVRAALEAGDISPQRWESYQKLRREAAYAMTQIDASAERAKKEKWKKIHREVRTSMKQRGKW